MSALKGGGKVDSQGYGKSGWEEWKDWPEDWQAEQVWWGAQSSLVLLEVKVLDHALATSGIVTEAWRRSFPGSRMVGRSR